MIKNGTRAWLALGLAACSNARAEGVREYQGVAELDERRLAFEVSGRLNALNVREGDKARAGAVLATLDAALDAQARAAGELEAQAALAQSRLVDRGPRSEEILATRARLRALRSAEELARKELARERGLHERGVTPQAGLDQAETSLAHAVAEREALESQLAEQERGARPEERDVARARAEAARANVLLQDLRIDRRELKAPLDGVILDVLIEPGEIALMGAPVLTLADPAGIYTEVFVPEAEVASIQLGAKAMVRADGISQALTGKVEHIEQRTEFTPRYLFSERERPNLVVRVKVEIEDPARRLHAGVPVFVAIEGSTPAAGPR